MAQAQSRMDCTSRVMAVSLLISQNLALQVWHRAMSQSKIVGASQDYVTTPDYLSLALGFSLKCVHGLQIKMLLRYR
jgi:hypothetical protein